MSPAVDRARVLGCAIDRLGMAEMVDRIDRVIATRDFAQHAAVNAAKLVAMRQDRELERIVSAAELISADGQSVVWASRVLSDPLPSRVAGIDLMFELFALAERRGYRVFILGARDDVLARALVRLHERHPALVVAGARDGYFSDEDAAAVADEIASHRPDIVFVAMPSPRKEYWLGDLRAPARRPVHHGRRRLDRRARRARAPGAGPRAAPRPRMALPARPGAAAHVPRATCRATRASSSTWRATSRGAAGTEPDAQRGSGGGAPTSSHSSATSVRQSQRSGLMSASPRAAARQRATPAVAEASQTTEMMMIRRVDTASGPRAVPGFNARATESLCRFRYASRRAIQRSYQRLTQYRFQRCLLQSPRPAACAANSRSTTS